MPSHHPSDALLFSYTAGSLSESRSLVLATHLTPCRDCARSVAVLEATAGALLVAAEPMALSPRVLEDTLAALDRPPPIPVLPVVNPGLPPPLDRAPAGRWWPCPWGLWVRRFQTGGPGICLLVEGRMGAVLPRHFHTGQELTVVLYGSYQNAEGVWRVGDFAEMASGNEDAPPNVICTKRAMLVISADAIQLAGAHARLRCRPASQCQDGCRLD